MPAFEERPALPSLLQDMDMYAPYDSEAAFLREQVEVLAEELAERDRALEAAQAARPSPEPEGASERGVSPPLGVRSASGATSEEGDRDVEMQVGV